MKRNIVVFGATSAIAMEAQKIWAAAGSSFFLVARCPEKLEHLREDLLTRGAERVELAVSDLNDMERHEELLKEAQKKLEGLDLALIAHGTLSDQKTCEASYQRAALEFRTNFLSVASLITHLANLFESEKRGTIA